MPGEDFHVSEQLLAETGRDGRRWPPEKLKRTMVPGSAAVGLLAGVISAVATRGEGDALLVREGLIDMSVWGTLLTLVACLIGWPLIRWLRRWYLKAAPFPLVMAYRFDRYAIVPTCVLLFFVGWAVPLVAAHLIEGRDLIESLSLP